MNDRIIFGAVLCEILAVAAYGCSFSGTGAGATVDASFFEADGRPSTTPSHDSGGSASPEASSGASSGSSSSGSSSGGTQRTDAGRSTGSNDGATAPD